LGISVSRGAAASERASRRAIVGIAAMNVAVAVAGVRGRAGEEVV